MRLLDEFISTHLSPTDPVDLELVLLEAEITFNTDKENLIATWIVCPYLDIIYLQKCGGG